MNKISDELYEKADSLFMNGASIREVIKACGIARETAHRIQKTGRLVDFDTDGRSRVNTGRRKDGSMSFYYTKEIRDHWKPIDAMPPAAS